MPGISLPDPPLADGVVVLRPFTRDDAAAVVEACIDHEIPRWTFMPEGLTLDQAERWIERSAEQWRGGDNARFAVVDADSDTFFGQVGLGLLPDDAAVGEIYYWVAANARRKRIATRAVRLISRWAFDVLGLERLQLFVDPANPASARVAERAGFVREGLLRSHQVFKGHRTDSVVYSLLPTDPVIDAVDPEQL